MVKYGVLISVRFPDWIVSLIRSLGYNTSDFIREATIYRLIEVCKDESAKEELLRYLDEKIIKIEKEIATLRHNIMILENELKELKSTRDNLSKVVDDFNNYISKVDEIVQEYFKDVDRLLREHSHDEVSRFIDVRLESLADKYGYPKSMLLKALLDKHPVLKEVLSGDV